MEERKQDQGSVLAPRPQWAAARGEDGKGGALCLRSGGYPRAPPLLLRVPRRQAPTPRVAGCIAQLRPADHGGALQSILAAHMPLRSLASGRPGCYGCAVACGQDGAPGDAAAPPPSAGCEGGAGPCGPIGEAGSRPLLGPHSRLYFITKSTGDVARGVHWPRLLHTLAAGRKEVGGTPAADLICNAP